MKRVASTILCVAVLLSVVYGVSGCSRKPKDWYKSALEYYSNGIKNGFTEENRKLSVSDDLKDPYNIPGYLLTDLDGVDECLSVLSRTVLIPNSQTLSYTILTWVLIVFSAEETDIISIFVRVMS